MIEIFISSNKGKITGKVYAGLEKDIPTFWYENWDCNNRYCTKISALEFANICANNIQVQFRANKIINPSDDSYEMKYNNPSEYTNEDWKAQTEEVD